MHESQKRNTWFGARFLAKCDTAFAQPACDPSFQPPPRLRVLLWPVWVLKTERGHEQKGNSLKELVLLSPEDMLGPLLKLLLLRLSSERTSLRNVSCVFSFDHNTTFSTCCNRIRWEMICDSRHHKICQEPGITPKTDEETECLDYSVVTPCIKLPEDCCLNGPVVLHSPNGKALSPCNQKRCFDRIQLSSKALCYQKWMLLFSTGKIPFFCFLGSLNSPLLLVLGRERTSWD